MPYKYNAITGELDLVGEEYTDNPILQIDTDSGSALPDADGILNVLGGDGIDTSGAGDTVTISLDGTVGRTLTGNTGGALSPTAGNWNILTDNSTPIFAGSVSTLTLDFGLSNLNLGSSMPSLGTGLRNVGVGLNNLVSLINGSDNVSIGVNAGGNIENGGQNISIGNNALLAITDSTANVAVGSSALQGLNLSDGFNTGVGHSSLLSIASGTYNTAIGYRSGANLSLADNSNILVGNRAITGDTHTIRIGNQGSGDDQQNECYIAGIVGVTNSNAQVVTIDSTSGQLGVSTTISESFTTNSGTATPVAGVLQVLGSHGINTNGATNIVDIEIDNAITLGDLSAIAAGSSALTCTTGDITISAANLNMPSTTSANVGVIEQNGNRFIHSYPDFRNTFVGVSSGNFTMSGISNVAMGHNAFGAATTSAGSVCIGAGCGDALQSGSGVTAVGFGALSASVTGGTCCAFGQQSQNATTSASNSSFGYQTLLLNVTGTALSAFGTSTLGKCTASSNSAFGNICCRDVTSGARNSAFGDTALVNLSTGNDNLALGYFAGQQLTLTDSSNILLLSTGTTGDNNTTRIGTQGAGARQQNKCFIAGIVGVTNSNAQSVTINSSTGQLGVGLSSLVAITEVTGTSSALVAGNSYIANNAGLVTLTLPSTGVLGDIIQITGKGVGLYSIAQNASQQIFNIATATTAGVTGSLTAVERYASLTLRCTTTNTGWTVVHSSGTFTAA